MVNYRQIYEDFRQRYQGTFVHVAFKEGQESQLFHLAEVTQVEGGPPRLTLVNRKSGVINLTYNTECEMTFPFPPTGYFWWKNKVATIFQRQNTRQWKRGICSGTSQIWSPYQNFYPFRIPLNEETLQEAFNPITVSLRDAMDFLNGEKILSVPLTENLALGQSPSTKYTDKVVWFLGKPIGTYNNYVFKIKETQFHQEVVDFIQKSGENAQVV